MIKLTDRIRNLHHSPTLKANDLVFQKRAANETVYHMGFGESPFPVPERLKTSLAAAAHRKEYLKAEGLHELIEAIENYYRPHYGDEYIKNSDVIVAPGSKLNIYALQMAVDGDLLLPVPSWVSYEPQARMLETEVIKVPTELNEAGYHIDPDVLRTTIKSARADGFNPRKIIINTPSNPTGLIFPEKELQDILQVCQEEEIFVISDEIYGFINYSGGYSTCAKYAPDITAVTTGISKHLSLGGWRIGVAFIPKGVEGLYDAMRCIVSETWSSLCSPLQQASIDAYMGHDDIEDHIQACTDIHALVNTTVSKGFRDLGIIAPTSQGGFYNYPNFEPFKASFAKHGIKTAQDLNERLLEEYNVATLPGSAFGAEEDVLTLRISGCDYDGAAALEAYQNGAALDEEFMQKYTPNVLKGVEQIGEFIKKYGT